MRMAAASTWDAGRTFLPHISKSPWMADTLLMVLLGGVLADIVYRRTRREQLGRVALVLSVHGVVLLLRSATIFSTVALVSPTVVERLLDGEQWSDIQGSIGFVANTNCFDMMFSGHASTGIVCALFVLTSHLPRVMRMLWVALGLFGAALQVLVGDHYTSDVVVGTYTATMVFLVHHLDFSHLLNARSTALDLAACTPSASVHQCHACGSHLHAKQH
jgi:hypothetical protein